VFIVGFDYGTHASKVVIRQRGTGVGRIAAFDKPAAEYQPGTSPSLVRIVDERMFFGAKALEVAGGELFPALKVALLPENHQHANAVCDGVGASVLVAAYLAWAFKELLGQVTELADSRVQLNVAAPMAHFESPALKEKYLRILHAAWGVSFGNRGIEFGQGVTLAEARRTLEVGLTAAVPSDAERMFDVYPETIAPIVSLNLDPLMAPGMYMIADCGASTTEISVFHVEEPGADQRVLCYCDRTQVVGAIDLQLADEMNHASDVATSSGALDKIRRQYLGVWYEGFKVDFNNYYARQRWKQLRVVLSGGGTLHSDVQSLLSETSLLAQWDIAVRVSRHQPGSLDHDGEIDDPSFFAVANGLSIGYVEWPVVYHQYEIEPLPPDETPVAKPEAYWYLRD
jgi:hypothetical protein